VLPAKLLAAIPGTQLNKQQLTTAKVSVGQSWKASGVTPHLGRVGRASWQNDWLPLHVQNELKASCIWWMMMLKQSRELI